MKTVASMPPYPFHDKLLLLISQADIDATQIEQFFQEVEHQSSWQKILQMAHQHALIPQLYASAQKYQDQLPSTFFSTLKTLNQTILFENMKLSAELIRLISHLDEKAIPYISIKGPALAQELYQNVGMRQISDLDILVTEADLPTITEILLDLGYLNQLPLSLLENRGFRALDNDFTFLHPDREIMVELHWKLFPDRHKMVLDFQTLYQESEQIHINAYPINVLSSEHNLLYLALHATKHLFEQLKWLCDIDVLIRKNPQLPFDAIINKASAWELSTPLYLALLMAKTLYNTPLPKRISEHSSPELEQLLQESLKLFAEDFTCLEESHKKKVRYLFLQKLNNSKQNRFLAIFIALFKPSSVDYIYYQLPERLNLLYPLLRPPRLLYKYGLKRLGL